MPVSPQDRPIPRPTARVVLIDSGDRLLLFKWLPSNVWITPGGAVEPGETYEEAADPQSHAGRRHAADVFDSCGRRS